MTPPTSQPSAAGRKARIETALIAGLGPLHLEVTDESHLHNVPPGAESHFKVLVVSETFGTERAVGRHRRVNALLRDELDAGLHALAIHAWTPAEWFARGGGPAPASPLCQGGAAKS